MALIRIGEKAKGDGFAVRAAMGDEGEFEAVVKPPFDDSEEQKLEWYFEEWLRYPFIYEQRADFRFHVRKKKNGQNPK